MARNIVVDADGEISIGCPHLGGTSVHITPPLGSPAV